MRTLSLALLLLSPCPALADVLTLDNGATLEGHLARFEHAGECELAVEAGELAGALVVVPCSRVVRMERSSPDGIGAPVAVAPLPPVAAPAPAAAFTDADAASVPVAPPEAAEPAAALPALAEVPPAEAPAVAQAAPAADPQPEAPPGDPETAAETREPEPARQGWRAALPEGLSLPSLGRREAAED